jgi:hypothetical protein
MKAAKRACLKHNLPTTRIEYNCIRNNAHCQQTASPTVSMIRITDPSMNRSTLSPILKTAVMETINVYTLKAIHAYTDGCAFEATLNAGY